MRRFGRATPRVRQQGWIGFVVILLALLIVAILARDALKQYGLGFGTADTTKAGTPGERARAPGAVGVEATDLGSAPGAPATALERARGVEDMVKRAAEEQARRGDGTSK